jgi:16S rRNA processing protein RimM
VSDEALHEGANPQAGNALVVVARVGAPHGVRGWVKVDCFGGSPSESLLGTTQWYIGEPRAWQRAEVAEITTHGRHIAVRLDGITDRDGATRLRHKQVALERSALPPTASGEYYWHDLQGLQVSNLQHEELGEVVDLIETGANQVLVVRGDREVLIPFLDGVIANVDMSARRLVVDWQADY